MDADHADEQCPTHGHRANCPSMCPIYDLPADDDRRQRYEALTAELGQRRAHLVFSDLPGHDEDGGCAWLDQFDAAGRADRLVGVHDYQTLQTVQHVKDGPDRDVIVDETPRSLKDQRRLSVADLTALTNALAEISALPHTPDFMCNLARFAREVRDIVSCASDVPDTLAALDPPAIPDDERTETMVEVDPDDLPTNIDPEDVETERRRVDVGMPAQGLTSRRLAEPPDDRSEQQKDSTAEPPADAECIR